MTGVILVVDDVPANIKLLEAKLTNEYYDVISAKDGYEAIKKAKENKPDLILLDVMMPGMDGFETCRQLKKDFDVSHIPVVMVTALNDPSDRVQGLESGADDFITKPINDTSLFARVKSLIRIKVLIDELRLRDQSGSQMGIMNQLVGGAMDVSGASIWLIDDDAVQCKRMSEKLSEQFQVQVFHGHTEALEKAKSSDPDLIVISAMLTEVDGLRLATQFKAIERVRHVPILMLVDEDDQAKMLKALELGVNDYLLVPVDYNEMQARVKTQLRRKRYQDALKSNYQESVSMAITDGLTGLYNRHYLDTHLKNLVGSSLEKTKPMSLAIMDMDHFKSVNDTFGHDVGDEVLRQLSQYIVNATRSADLVARYGGEEFVVLMPETDFNAALEVAERIRKKVETTPFIITHEQGTLSKTISIGVSTLNHAGDTPETLLKRADNFLYTSKHSGRNQVNPKSRQEAMTGAAAPEPAAPPQPRTLQLFTKAEVEQPPAPPAPPVSAAPPQPMPAPAPSYPSFGNLPPPTPAVTAAPSYMFDPALHEKISTVTNAGQGSNQIQLTSEQRHRLAELKPVQAKPIDAPAKKDGGTIDDEPPGTF